MNDAEYKKLSEAEKQHFYYCLGCGEWVDRRDLSSVLDHNKHAKKIFMPKLTDLFKSPLPEFGDLTPKKSAEGSATAHQHGAASQGATTPKKMTTDNDDDDDDESAKAPRWVPIAKAFCEIFKTLGLLVVGGWVVYTFWAKKEAETAVAQYQTIQLQNAEAQKKVLEFPTVKIRPESIEKVGDGYIVILSLQVANKGGTDYTFSVGDHSICLARVEFNGKGGSANFVERQFSPLRILSEKSPETETATINSLTIKSGAEAGRYLCFSHVTTPGAYYAEFKTSYHNGLLLSNASFLVGLEQGKTGLNGAAKSVETHE